MLKSKRITNVFYVEINADAKMEATPSRNGQSHPVVGLVLNRKNFLPLFFNKQLA